MPIIKKYFTDIVACVKFDDIYCFFSFRELYEHSSFSSTRFINTPTINFSQEVKLSLEKNEFIGVGDIVSRNNIVMKKSLYDFFQFGYFDTDINQEVIENSSMYRRTITGIMRYLNGEDTSLGTTNFLSDYNFPTMNTYGNPKNIFYMRVLENNFIYPPDIEEFSRNAAFVSGKNFSDFNLKITDIPRLVDASLLNVIFSQLGARQMDAGSLCYTVVTYENRLFLEKNININVENIVTDINQNHFQGISECEPDAFRIGDTIIGMLQDGVFVPMDKNFLKGIENHHMNNLRIYSENMSDKKFIKQTKKEYPQKSLYLLTSRYRKDYPYDEEEKDFTLFSNAFYNLVSFYKPGKSDSGINISLNSVMGETQKLRELTNFRIEVIREFLHYINNNYIKTEEIQERNYPNRGDILGSLENIQNSISSGNRLISTGERIPKEYFIYIICSLTRISDPNIALVEFLSSPAITYGDYEDKDYPYLRSISFFVTCDKYNSCGNLVAASETDVENITFAPLIDQVYEVYYNIRLDTFSNFPI